MPPEQHFPGKTEAEFTDPAPAPEETPAPAPSDAPQGDTPPADPNPGDAPAPEAPAPTDEPVQPPEVPLLKKRSIYDDLKDTRQEKNAFKDAAIAALKAQGIELTGKETAEQLQALAKKTPSPAPTPPSSQPANELESYAKENNLDPAALSRLVEIISKQIPASQLTEQERNELTELKDWQKGKQAEDARAAEDAEIMGQRDHVKKIAKELGFEIHQDGEAEKVMQEIKRLAHTKEFHDKPVDYIVFAKRAELSKLVSPKKPSFESGGGRVEAEAPAEVAFDGKMTPAQAQKAVSTSAPKSVLEIRSAK